MRPDITSDKINIVFFHQFVCFLFADARFKPVVFNDEFNFTPAHGVAHVFQRQVDGVNHVFTDNTCRGCQGGNKADFYRICRLSIAGSEPKAGG